MASTGGAGPRVVVTGLGVVAPGGLDIESFFHALVTPRPAVRRIDDLLGDDRFEVRIGAPVDGFDSVAAVGEKEDRRQARFTKLAIAAAKQAAADAGLRTAGYAPERIGTAIGVGLGGLEIVADASTVLRERGPSRINPFAVPALIPNMAAGLVAIELDAQGPSSCTATACASSIHALGSALSMLRSGEADAVVAGGAEAALHPLAIAGFARMAALSRRNDEPARASRPFDADRDGFVLGEGAGMLVLEREDGARRRGARIYAELAGCGFSADAFHRTRPLDDGRGAALAMARAMDDARIAPAGVGYVNAHGTGTRANDASECRAIRRAFGHVADRLWVSSTKGVTGHLLGAAGAVESIATVLTLARGVVPPTANLDTPDRDCDLDLVPRTARERRFEIALCNSFAFGGQNGALAFRKI